LYMCSGLLGVVAAKVVCGKGFWFKPAGNFFDLGFTSLHKDAEEA